MLSLQRNTAGQKTRDRFNPGGCTQAGTIASQGPWYVPVAPLGAVSSQTWALVRRGYFLPRRPLFRNYRVNPGGGDTPFEGFGAFVFP